jgi:hypothetical protein
MAVDQEFAEVIAAITARKEAVEQKARDDIAALDAESFAVEERAKAEAEVAAEALRTADVAATEAAGE